MAALKDYLITLKTKPALAFKAPSTSSDVKMKWLLL